MREALIPSLVPEYDREDVCSAFISAMESSQTPQFADDVAVYCEDERTSALMGYGVYPRFFDEGEGYYDRSYDHYFGKQDYSRIVFRIAGQQNGKIYIKTDESNIRFENGALVYVLGRDKPKFEAQMVIVGVENPQFIISGSILAGDNPFSVE